MAMSDGGTGTAIDVNFYFSGYTRFVDPGVTIGML